MNGSDASSSTTGGGRLRCGCGQTLAFGVDVGDKIEPQKLRHGDGTPVCEAGERNLRGNSLPMLPVVSGKEASDRRALAEARLLAEIDAADGSDRRTPYSGVLYLLIGLLTFLAAMAWIVITHWPSSNY